MKNNSIQITATDAARLGRMLDTAVRERHLTSVEATKFRCELERASIVPPATISAERVTMNSTIDLLDLETGEEETYTLVFPENADAVEGKISILAPIGASVFGCCVGDILNSAVPSGTRRLKIRNIVYQPEASGDFHL